MLEIGERDGFVCENVDGYAGHIDIGDEEAAFGILGHLDVVPCNKEGWNTDPYEVTIKMENSMVVELQMIKVL